MLGADLGQEQAEADPPLGELAVLLGRLDVVVVVALVVVVLLVPELVGDLPRLDVDEVGGSSKLTRSSSASISRRLRIARLAWAYSSPRRVRICPLSASRISAPEAGGERVVDLGGLRRLHRLDGDREGRLLAGEVLRRRSPRGR